MKKAVLSALVVLVSWAAQADNRSDYRVEFVKKVAEPCILKVVSLDPDVRSLYLTDDKLLIVGLAVARPSVNRMIKATFPDANGKQGRDRDKLFKQYLDDCIAVNVKNSNIQAE